VINSCAHRAGVHTPFLWNKCVFRCNARISYSIKKVLLFRFLFWVGGENLHPVVYYAGSLLLLVLVDLLIHLFLWHPAPRRNPIYKKKKELLKNWRIMYLILCHLNNTAIM